MSFSDAVDFYNSETEVWSTAQLSVARDLLASSSVRNVALFAGGRISNPHGGMFYAVWPIAAFHPCLFR